MWRFRSCCQACRIFLRAAAASSCCSLAAAADSSIAFSIFSLGNSFSFRLTRKIARSHVGGVRTRLLVCPNTLFRDSCAAFVGISQCRGLDAISLAYAAKPLPEELRGQGIVAQRSQHTQADSRREAPIATLRIGWQSLLAAFHSCRRTAGLVCKHCPLLEKPDDSSTGCGLSMGSQMIRMLFGAH